MRAEEPLPGGDRLVEATRLGERLGLAIARLGRGDVVGEALHQRAPLGGGLLELAAGLVGLRQALLRAGGAFVVAMLQDRAANPRDPFLEGDVVALLRRRGEPLLAEEQQGLHPQLAARMAREGLAEVLPRLVEATVVQPRATATHQPPLVVRGVDGDARPARPPRATRSTRRPPRPVVPAPRGTARSARAPGSPGRGPHRPPGRAGTRRAPARRRGASRCARDRPSRRPRRSPGPRVRDATPRWRHAPRAPSQPRRARAGLRPLPGADAAPGTRRSRCASCDPSTRSRRARRGRRSSDRARHARRRRSAGRAPRAPTPRGPLPSPDAPRGRRARLAAAVFQSRARSGSSAWRRARRRTAPSSAEAVKPRNRAATSTRGSAKVRDMGGSSVREGDHENGHRTADGPARAGVPG